MTTLLRLYLHFVHPETNVIKGLNKIDAIQLEESKLIDSFSQVMEEFLRLGGTDQVAKGTALVAALNGEP